MISLGLRLTISGGREAAIRLVLLVAAAGLGASLAIIAATFPLLRRITSPEAARNE